MAAPAADAFAFASPWGRRPLLGKKALVTGASQAWAAGVRGGGCPGRQGPQPWAVSGWLSRTWLPLGSRTAASRTP